MQLLIIRVVVGDDHECFWKRRGTPGHVKGADCWTMLTEMLPALRKRSEWETLDIVHRVRAGRRAFAKFCRIGDDVCVRG